MKTDYRIGAQILSPKMIECSFLHTDAVLETIESIRATAEAVHVEYCQKLRERPKEALMETRGYTNAVSILGSRGSGKTSIILTLQHILRVGKDKWENSWRTGDSQTLNPENIMMPVLVPQDFSDRQPLLSWIISQLQNLAESALTEMGSKDGLCWGSQPFREWTQKDGNAALTNPLAEAIEKLTTSFELRYRNEYGGSAREGDQIYHYMDSVERDSNLMLDMLTLISMLIDYYRFKNSRITAKEPLLFFVIDDLDMAPQRSNEVLNLMLRYLQHPNVVVLCGWNQELFQNHLSIELLRTQGVLESGNVNVNFGFDDVFMSRQRKRVTAMDSARRLAIDSLKKAFPPAQRFEIRGLSTEQRANFPLLSSTEKEDPQTFLELIDDTIAQCDFRRQKRGLKGRSFLYNKGEPIYAYMRIFDNKCRGMINECKAFDELWKLVQGWDKTGSLDLTNALNELLNTILFSTTRFAPFRRGIRDLVTITEVVLDRKSPKYSYFCNYKAVDKVLADYEERQFQWESKGTIAYEYELEMEFCYFPSVIIDVYLLLDFIENLIRSIVNAPYVEHHTSQSFSEALNKINPPVQVNAADKNPTMQALAAAGISEIPYFPKTRSLRLCVLLLDNYERRHFSDGHYSFSGTYMLCCMLDAALSLSFENGHYILPEQSTAYNEESRAWVNTLQKALFALEASASNIKRLARFQSLQNQLIYADTEEILRAEKPSAAMDFDALIVEKPFSGKTVTDRDLRDLVYCLRETDKLRRALGSVLQEGTRKAGLSQNQKKYMIESGLFISRFNKIQLRDGWIDIADYMAQMNKYTFASRADLENVSQYDPDLIREAFDLTEKRTDDLLDNLRMRLEYAFGSNYQIQVDLKNQYRYLRSASSAIGEYLKSWELVDAGWTEEDQAAAEELQQIFYSYALDTPYILAKRLAEYGPELSSKNRDRYKSSLGELKGWVSPRVDQFKIERPQIEQALNVLSRAPEHIRRSLIVEQKMFELLKELGLLIASGVGDRAYEIWKMKKENPLEWSSPVVWSVEGHNLEIIREWCDRLRKAGWNETDSEEQDELRSRATTKFDLNYLF